MDQSKKHLGIIIMNLGSPDSTEVADVKRYLDEFLMDKKVMDYPYLYRTLLVQGIITPRRAPRSAEAYKKTWLPEGSPLIVLTERLRAALEQESGIPVETVMRYGNPRPEVAYKNLMKRVPELKEVILIPLYPHYAMASYETAAVYVKDAWKKGNYPFRLTVIRPFYQNQHYIELLADVIRPYLKQPTDYLLFSYHGVPVRHIRKGDITGQHCLKNADCCAVDSPAHKFCYRHQVIASTHLTAQALGLETAQYGISFQSRLGKTEWMQPYTSDVLSELPKKGIKRLVVTCPAFATDCLETLEEIAMEGKEIFLQAGGEAYETTVCLNDNPAWVTLLNTWVQQIAAGDRAMVFEKELA